MSVVVPIMAAPPKTMEPHTVYLPKDVAIVKPLCRCGCVMGGSLQNYPAHAEVRSRVSAEEWATFYQALKDALYDGSPIMASISL